MGYANRGKAFEELIEYANAEYKARGLAIINKVPTPTKILNNGKGFYNAKSTVDFTGTIAGGKFVCFDTKQTAQTTRFPLDNIKSHQIEYMQSIVNMGGIAFILVNFSKLDEYYRLEFSTLKDYLEEYKKYKGRRGLGSIPKMELKNNICQEYGIVLNYLKGLI